MVGVGLGGRAGGMGTGSLEGGSQPAAWRLGGLAAWMLMAMMMRVGMRMLMNDDRAES